jgi:hypothetical protein
VANTRYYRGSSRSIYCTVHEPKSVERVEFTAWITAKGYVGFAGDSTAVRDHVFVLPGGANPFLLRRAEQSYLLVDCCSVHGMMNGEIVKLCGRGNCPCKILKPDKTLAFSTRFRSTCFGYELIELD